MPDNKLFMVNVVGALLSPAGIGFICRLHIFFLCRGLDGQER